MVGRVDCFCYRHRWSILAAWLVALVGGLAAMRPVVRGAAASRPVQRMEADGARGVAAMVRVAGSGIKPATWGSAVQQREAGTVYGPAV